MSLGPLEFTGTDRFEIKGRLGSGASGEVYKVYDHKLESYVALKTLFKTDPGALFQFKKEFRALADVNHPHLVQLYELLSEGERWFFTMELVEGLDFIDHARAQPGTSRYDTGRFYSSPTLSPPPDINRLRAAARQLAEGLYALHRAGKLHCDIKPSNIRVTPSGRVVLLDFGLVRELYPSQIYETMDAGVAGTPAYMSPEQAAGRKVTAASDWYSVGILLYEALTGQLPFSGGFLKIIMDKQKIDPKPPQELISVLPDDLSNLCLQLLERNPKKRPQADRILQRLGGPSRPTIRSGHGSSSFGASHFVGRENDLRTLELAFGRTRQDRTAIAWVHGSSGVGKSALARRFLKQIRENFPDAVLLAGRCYERESVPYRALDSLIDALSRFLRRQTDHEIEAWLPADILALARLFPVLRRVQAIAGAERRVLDIPDSREQRRRAFQALRELLTRLAQDRPLLLFIDDLQWGDLDSAALVEEILRPPESPTLMLLGCFRGEERERSPFLRSLIAAPLASATTDQIELSLQELSAEEAHQLAMDLLGGPDDTALATTISQESGGSPFFIDELVRYSRALADFDQASERSISSEVERALSNHMSIERLISARLERVPAEARRLLEIVSVAGQPIALEAARQAARLGSDTQTALTILRAASLSRLRGDGELEEIEVYHDRVRDAVLQSLEPARLRELHRRLALALEGSGRADPETLAVHFMEAGDRTRAADFATAAARQASDALAFDRAARLYRFALELEVFTSSELRRLRVNLADALTNAGRGAEAAEVYLQAADGAKAAEALELRRRAAEQLLISGHIDQGLETVRTVLASIGMSLPVSPRQALLSLAWRVLRLRLRGLQFRERDSTQITAEELIRIDTCWSVSIGLGTVDTIRGMGFAKEHLLLALEAGEPYRIARALAIEAGYSGANGIRAQARTERLVEASMTLAERVGHPHAVGLANVTAGMAAYLEGRWRQACELLDKGEKVLREDCTGVTWELDTAMSFQLRSLLFVGDFVSVRQRLPRFLKDVREKGDLYAEVNLRCRAVWVAMLVEDDPAGALREVEDAIRRWSQNGFHIQHYWHLTGQVEIALYRGEALEAWGRLEKSWPALERSLLLRIQLTRAEALILRARAALAAVVDSGPETADGRSLIKQTEACLRKVEKERLAWADPLAALARAGLASIQQQWSLARDLLTTATAGFETADMDLHAAICRRVRGQISENEGKRLIRTAESWLSDQGVVAADRLAKVIAPGSWKRL